MNTKAIIFDLDGTLWDTTEQVELVWQKIAKRYKKNITKQNVKEIMGLDKKQIINKLFSKNKIEGNKFINECQIQENIYLKEYGGGIYINTIDTLKRLFKLNYKLYIVSNCQDGYIQAFLSYYKIKNLILDYECSGRTGENKEENIRKILKRNSIENAIYVGDIENDFFAAKKNNIKFVWAKYGFGLCEEYDECINDIREIIEIVN